MHFHEKPDFTNTPVSPKRPHYNYQLQDPDEKPFVTIITPYYNTGEVFRETAESVFKQSFQQWEWIIVNDGSREKHALQILDDYRRADSRVHILDLDRNLGPGGARNAAFRTAQSEFLVLLDSDDLLEPDALEKWLWFLVSHPECSFVNSFSFGFGAEQYIWPIGFGSASELLQENKVIITSMIRKSVYDAVGGLDENIQGGMEDWDFWLKCAAQGYWGCTIPEYHSWYRRRASHSDRWVDWDCKEGLLQKFQKKYPALYEKGMPTISHPAHLPNATLPQEIPFRNRLQKRHKRLMMILPWMVMGGADKFNLDLLRGLQRAEWEVTVVTTLPAEEQPWMHKFQALTPDVFVLNNFLRLVDFPRFLKYLIDSRDFDAVLISNSELGYWLLPFLRATFPNRTFLDYCHMEQIDWRNGGYPQYSIMSQPLLDVSVVSSNHLKNWMVGRGASKEKIEVCTINIDCSVWKPDLRTRAAVRTAYQISPDSPLILYAARICEQKLPVVLAKTLQAVHQQGVEFNCLVAGDGPDLEKLRNLIHTYGLQENVRLLGGVANEKIRELMIAADILFLPSQWEGIALTLYEAMAAGACVVGSDVGGQAELVTAESGMLIKPGGEEELVASFSKALVELLSNPKKRAKMSKSGRQRVEQQFPIEQMEHRMIQLIEQARQATRSVPSLATLEASNAIEYFRLNYEADRLWTQNTSLILSRDQIEQNCERLAKLADYNFSVVPPASAATFFYFGFRSMFLGVYQKLRSFFPGIENLKAALKSLVIHDKTLH